LHRTVKILVLVGPTLTMVTDVLIALTL